MTLAAWNLAADPWTLWPIVAVVVLPTIALLLYRRQVRYLAGPLRWVLPALRALTLLILALMLLRPAVQRGLDLDRLGRLLLFVDTSPSMNERDDLDAPRVERARALAQTLARAADRRIAVETIEIGQAGTTDLLTPLLATEADDAPTTAVVLSDGRQTAAGPERDVADTLAASGIVASGVLIGSEAEPPPDVTLIDLTLPDRVQATGRVTGSATVLETAPAGTRYTLTLSVEDEEPITLPQTSLGTGRRVIPLDLPAVDLTTRPGLLLGGGTIALADRPEEDGPAYPFALRVEDVKTSLAVLDGRPRWETRQLSASLERQEELAVASALVPGEPQWAAALASFDDAAAIVLGEIRESDLPESSRAALERVVGRGTGLIWIDGTRGLLAEVDASETLAPLLPVRRGTAEPMRVARLRLTAAGRDEPALRLLPDPEANAALWQRLPTPTWAADAQALPEVGRVLVEAVGDDSQVRPFIVAGLYGRGQIWYVGGDEFWRWRRGVGDRWQTRLWTGIVRAAARPPSAAENETLALYLDAVAVAPGEAIEVRVEEFEASDVDLTAKLRREGETKSSTTLPPGVERTATLVAPDDPGRWEIVVERADGPKLAAEVAVVEPAVYDELAQPIADRQTLQPIVDATGGLLVTEEDVAPLLTSLARPPERSTATRRYELWASRPLLLLVAALLTIEWALRRRGGLA